MLSRLMVEDFVALSFGNTEKVCPTCQRKGKQAAKWRVDSVRAKSPTRWPRLIREAPFVKIQGPTVWTTLALTMHADGTSTGDLTGATTFPRHWLYDGSGTLVGKSAVIDFDEDARWLARPV